MSMDILRATKLKYGAIHSTDPKQMCKGRVRSGEHPTFKNDKNRLV